MKLHSPAFFKRLRQGVKVTVRLSPGLRREFRVANKFRRRYTAAPLARPIVTLGFGFAVYSVAALTHHVAAALALVSVWAFAWVFIQAQTLRLCLFESGDLSVLSLLPVMPSTIFRWELQKFFRKAIFSLGDLTAGFVALGIQQGFSPAKLISVLPFAIISWATMLSLSCLCASRLPRLPYQLIVSAFFIFGFVLIVGHNLVGHALLDMLDTCAPEFNTLLPTGWAALLFQLLLPGSHWTTCTLLVPVGLIIWTIKNSIESLRCKYAFTEPIAPESADIIPRQIEVTPSYDAGQHSGAAAIEEIVQSRQFLLPANWNNLGRLEGGLWRWFDDREKRLAEFVFPDGFAISGPWKKIALIFFITVAVAFVIGTANPLLESGILGLGGFVSLCRMLARVFANGNGFRLMWSSTVLVPFYSNFNIGFREMVRLLMKCSVVQLPFVLAYTMASGAVIASLYRFPVFDSVVFGFKTGCLIFAGRIIMLVFAFSSGTNDTSRFRLSAVSLIAVVIFLCVLFLILAGASLLVPDLTISGVLLAAAVLNALIFLWVYSWFYHRGRFDLMKVPQK